MTAPRGRFAEPSLGLAALLTTLVALGPLSTDLYLPALPSLAQELKTDVARVQLTLSVFLAGFALGQLAYGALSDRFGRRPMLLLGLGLYLLASLACLFATTIDMLIGAHFVQALGACAGPVLGRAIVRDVWGPLEAARVLAYVSGAMAIAPLIGPTLGGLLTVAFGWQANFAALVIFSTLQVTAVWFFLRESNAHPDPLATRPGRMLSNFGVLLRDRRYISYLLAQSFAYAVMFAFISGSSFILIGRHGLSPAVFGISFGLVVSGYIAGNMVSGRLVRGRGSDRLLLDGAWTGALAGGLMFLLAWWGVDQVWALLLPMFFSAMALGLVMPNALGGALAHYPRMAGVASALLGFCQMSIAAIVGMVVGHGLGQNPIVLPVTVALCSLLVPLSYLALIRPRKVRSSSE